MTTKDPVSASLDLRASAARRDLMTLKRLDTIVADLLETSGIDCWVLVSREYADDPVVMTMLPATWVSSRRRTILVFFRSQPHRVAVSRYEVDDLFPAVWDVDDTPDQWDALFALIAERDPGRIAVNMSRDFAHGDGLTATEHDALRRALGPNLGDRLTADDDLAVGWLERRLPEERPTLVEATSVAHDILRRALSTEAVRPSHTTTVDLEWWLRARVQEIGTQVWFHPTVSVQRNDGDLRGSFSVKPGSVTIERGDLIHIDFGIVWDGLCTDQQQHGYALRPGESTVPEGLTAGMNDAKRLQDILMGHFEAGRTGNDILRHSLDQATYEAIVGRIYSHPIGFHGHGAGSPIGLWDQQTGVPGSGDRPVVENTAWSIELGIEAAVAQWDNATVRIMLEEDAWFDGETCEFLDGRQQELWLI
jgi:Metallopeptidase family M24